MLRFAQHDIDEVGRIATQSLTELGEVYLPRNYMLRAAANASTIDVVNFGFLINRKIQNAQTLLAPRCLARKSPMSGR